MDIKEINSKTKEGRLLMMALAALTVSPQVEVDAELLDGRHITPNDMLDRINNVVKKVYKDDQIDPFDAAAHPLIQYLAENHHPHHTAIVTGTGAELLEGQKSTGEVMDYIKD
jgi:hypothetical protein